MAETPPRLLVTLSESELLHRELARRLPGIPTAFARPDSEGPWPTVEALLVGAPQRELPKLEPRLVPNLRFVQRIYTGLDAFPFDRFAPGVQVAGNVGGFAPYVAEQALALLLALANDLVPNCKLVREGRIRPVDPPRRLIGRTALLLGFGSIAGELATRLRSFGVRVEGVSRTGASDPRAERMYPASALLEALACADIVIDCRPLTASTRSTIDRAALSRMKPDAMLVNVGRAGTVDEEALYEHLRAHPGFRYATDVLWREDFGKGTVDHRWPFTELSNFLASPHIAGIGPDARERALGLALANLARFFGGLPPLHVADRREYE
jgi:phosphoglycerate dehydrogenase-like enzyme